MSRTLPRYLMGAFIPRFLAVLGSLTFILLMSFIVRVFKEAFRQGVPASWLWIRLLDLLPFQLTLAIPMGFLVSMLLTLGALRDQGEITALRASGFSPWQFLWPFSWVAGALCVLLLFFNHKASPDGLNRFKSARAEVRKQVKNPRIEARRNLRFGRWSLYADSVDVERKAMSAVLLRQARPDGKVLQVAGDRGSYELDPGRGLVLRLKEGTFQLTDPKEPEALLNARFETYEVMVDLSGGALNRLPATAELATPALWSRLSTETLPESVRAELKTEISGRFAGAFAPLLFFLIACPLALASQGERSSGRSKSYAASLVVLLAYYGIAMYGIGLGRKFEGLSYAAPWLPVALGLAASVWLWKRELSA